MVLMAKSNIGRQCVKLVLDLMNFKITKEEFQAKIKELEKILNSKQLTLDFDISDYKEVKNDNFKL